MTKRFHVDYLMITVVDIRTVFGIGLASIGSGPYHIVSNLNLIHWVMYPFP
jgi:hypothetical protein